MPLFSRKNANTVPASSNTAAAHPNPVTTHHGRTRISADSHRSGGGLFSSRHRTSSSLSSSDRELNHTAHKTSTMGSLFHRNSAPEDPSLSAARQRVAAAEQAEVDADRALAAARLSVREARDHVKALEREAEEEARLAKIKQRGAKDLNKRAKPLGRHGRY